ncbi:malto-oligosyltrehalose synthase [Cumulibacter manganitolerans]|uniref:malto-oligosyltrehalose synthase n=1 Tax=Cumulibacter manganitolerans TaxID=1884992 RepID=UPI0012960791|nr:malto-oligosyltrehalose synthase [Cumulibacter manganitolerans]
MRSPTSTYRLQITPDFTLFDAAGRLPYLHDLGVDWVYLSPILQASPGSSHGYDVVDHSRVDDARGGPEGLAALSAEARRLGMGVLVDIVPNHMGVAEPHENAAWWDLLRGGQDSAYAAWFDVDWEAGGGRIRIPVVGDDDLGPGGQVTNLRVVGDELHYHDNRYPIAPGTGGGTPDEVHARQHYELVGWRRADHDLNYRRFFGITTLAAIRVEDDAVFDASHREIGRWFDEGLVDGLRIDHPDGLRDPAGYLARLRARTGGAFVVVEKILEPGERLEAWECEGSTGYDTLAFVDRVLVDPRGERPLTALGDAYRDAPLHWYPLIHDTKRAVADQMLASETHRIGRELRWEDAGLDPADLDDALAELLACFPVYRSYLPDGRAHLEHALLAARLRRPDLAGVLERVGALLSDPAIAAAQRFQQTSGMVMAKGVEDNGFYRYLRLTSLNEVGGDPAVFAVPTGELHRQLAERQARWPRAMNALSTHDTKRSEDVRARIDVLSEVPQEWAAVLEELADELPPGDPSIVHLVAQAVFGTWHPRLAEGDGLEEYLQRLSAYAQKAAREAGTVTTWIDPDAAHETALTALVEKAARSRRLADLVARTDDAWRTNVLTAKLVNLTMPGFPDVYQGTERLDDSLVDPDNRRAVLWDALTGADAADSDLGDLSRAKAHVVRAALRLRRDRPELFTGYAPIVTEGTAREHLIAFDRGGAVTVASRWAMSRGDWADSHVMLPDGHWRDVLTGKALRGGRVEAAGLLDRLPVALLVRDAS